MTRYKLDFAREFFSILSSELKGNIKYPLTYLGHLKRLGWKIVQCIAFQAWSGFSQLQHKDCTFIYPEENGESMTNFVTIYFKQNGTNMKQHHLHDCINKDYS